jgi:hypothetical protein
LSASASKATLALVDIGKTFPFAPSTHAFYERTALPQALALEERLEQTGNALPTFERAYNIHKKVLVDEHKAIKDCRVSKVLYRQQH